jgi:hypothetical protein
MANKQYLMPGLWINQIASHILCYRALSLIKVYKYNTSRIQVVTLILQGFPTTFPLRKGEDQDHTGRNPYNPGLYIT